MSIFRRPLAICTDDDIDTLLRCLWSFPLCMESHEPGAVSSCPQSDCPWYRKASLTTFIEFYKHLCCTYMVKAVKGGQCALESHSDLLQLMKTIQNHNQTARYEFEETCLTALTAGRGDVAPEDRHLAIDLAARVLTMINCQSQNMSLGLVEFGNVYHGWCHHVSFSDFIEDCFTGCVSSSPIHDVLDQDAAIRADLTADRVMRKAKLRFKATDDLRRHLTIDRQPRVVEIFHQVGYLKEHLRLTQGQAVRSNLAEQIRLWEGHQRRGLALTRRRSAIPRQVALEVLDSIQKVLFRHSDQRSQLILKRLVAHAGFDEGYLHFDSSSIRSSQEEEVKYRCFGDRMLELHEEMENPAPYGLVEKWLERKSGARYVMLATLIGVICAVFLGVLSLAVSVVQTYISYQAWKHPVAG